MTPQRFLLDSPILIWLLDGRTIGTQTVSMLKQATHTYCSAATIWELTIKVQSGKLELPQHFLKLVADSGFELLDITSEHALSISKVKLPHHDPFDRLLLAQAQAENLSFITADAGILAAGYKFTIDATK